MVIETVEPIRVKFGRLGSARVGTGYYVYTGSALGKGALSLERRLGRHIRRAKTVRWHIDYLTAHDECVVRAVVYVKSRRRLECLVNERIRRSVGVRVLLPRLGATDCTCQSHLMRADGSSLKTILNRVRRVYSEFDEPSSFYAGPRSSGLLPIF